MNRERNIKHKKMKRSTVIFIAAAVIACTGTATAFAAGFGVFDNVTISRESTLVNEHGVECKIDKFDNDDYDQIAAHSEALEDKWYTNDELAVSVDRVYFDGRNLFIALKGYMLDENTSNTGYISLIPAIRVSDSSDNQEISGCIRNQGSLIRNEGENNSFSGVVKFEFDDDNVITEETDVDITLSGIQGAKEYYAGDQTFASQKSITLNVTAKPDESLRVKTDETVSEDGFEAKIYEISPAGIIVGTKYPPEYGMDQGTIDIEEGGNVMEGPKYSIIALFYDENGNEIEGLSLNEEIDYNDGFKAGMIQATDSKKITVKWYNKQERDNSNELGMKLYHEQTFDLTDNS